MRRRARTLALLNELHIEQQHLNELEQAYLNRPATVEPDPALEQHIADTRAYLREREQALLAPRQQQPEYPLLKQIAVAALLLLVILLIRQALT